MSSTTTFSFPTSMTLGVGARHALPQTAARFGSRVLIVTDPGVARLAWFDALVAEIAGATEAVSVFAGVGGNPDETHVDAGVEAFHAGACDIVVGIGGGSPLDAAKAVALQASHPGKVVDYDDRLKGYERIDDRVHPIVAVPTTAGTGSEVGRSAVITNLKTGLKTVIFSPHLLPRAAIIDPELMVGLPPSLTATTGMDALSHSVEAFLATGYHPMCDGIALEAIRMITTYLPRAVANGGDLEAREQMAMASAMGAVAFQKGLGATHSLAHPLSTLAGLHHGLANALFLHRVMRFNLPAAEERLARIGRAMGLDGSVAQRAEAAMARVEALAEEIGIPKTLTEAGVSAELLDGLVEQAVADACHHSNPRPVSADDFRDLYREAF